MKFEFKKTTVKTLICTIAVTALFVIPAYGKDIAPEKAIQKDTTKNTTNVPTDVLKSQGPTYKKGTYHVAHDGTGDFTSLSTAVVLVPSGSTLIVHEGIYNEALDIQTK